MSARLITKCPGCDRVTGDCIDSTLAKDRVEYDGKRCINCGAKPKSAKITPYRENTSGRAIGFELRRTNS